MYASLTNFQIPCNLPNPNSTASSCYSFSLDYLSTSLSQRGFSCVVFTVNERYFARIACQIYNELLDYQELAQAIVETIANVPSAETQKFLKEGNKSFQL